MFRWAKQKVRALIPQNWLDAYRRRRYGRTWFEANNRPARAVFTEIYSRNLWGGKAGDFYSGPGSDSDVARPYIEVVSQFIRDVEIRSVLDIGCGDFRVGEQLAKLGVKYCGIDVVPDLIAALRTKHGSKAVTFDCLDATTQQLPPADLCLIRQVLQHLSNSQVIAVLKNCAQYRYCIVTEHVLPLDRLVRPNLDIPTGDQTRVDIGSCLVLDSPPFHCSIHKTLCEVELPDGSMIRTVSLTSTLT